MFWSTEGQQEWVGPAGTQRFPCRCDTCGPRQPQLRPARFPGKVSVNQKDSGTTGGLCSPSDFSTGVISAPAPQPAQHPVDSQLGGGGAALTRLDSVPQFPGFLVSPGPLGSPVPHGSLLHPSWLFELPLPQVLLPAGITWLRPPVQGVCLRSSSTKPESGEGRSLLVLGVTGGGRRGSC